MVARIAIVGRPNVGKSTLFNRLTGRRLALVHETPGLTRDRREGDADIGFATIRLIDTAGLEQAGAGTIEARMQDQTKAAISDADMLLFVIDARSGVVPADEIFADLVRTSGKPVVLVANKCEGQAGQGGFYEAYSLGLGEPVAISAEHNEGMGDLARALEAACEAIENSPDGADSLEPGQNEMGGEEKPVRIAIVGRPNAGKSTLANALAGDERMITGPEAGITRDSIAIELEWKGHDIRLFDTAGLRKKARVKAGPEKLSVSDALHAIRFAEVVILLVDAQVPFEKQDLQIASLIAQEGRALVVAVNKWDLVRDKKSYLKELGIELERLVPQVRGVPLIPVSALRSNGLEKLMRAVFKVYETWNQRIPTAALNRWLEQAQERHPPPAVRGKRIRLRFMAQPNARPPTFVVFSSRADKLPESYRRYLIQGLRDAFDMPAVPIRLNLRKGKNPYANKRASS
ncbi:MAG: ribosome biogenesis GTPase Der [Methyloligellaceae bacterium]